MGDESGGQSKDKNRNKKSQQRTREISGALGENYRPASKITRRKFLEATLAAGVALSFAPTFGRLAGVPLLSDPGRRASADSSVLSNIIVVLQENHTFDNYFATYPGANGASTNCLPKAAGSSKMACQFRDANLTPADLPHKWDTAHGDYDSGRMDAFVYVEGNNETLGYYNRDDLPHYYNGADNYVLCDNFFSSEMSQSGVNHVYLVAGTSGGAKNKPSTPMNFPPIFKQLDSDGISWRVYQATTGTLYQQFEYIQDQPSSYQAEHFASKKQFAKDLNNKNLRQISWIVGAPGGDEHPPKDIRNGENSVANDIVNPVGASSYWNSVAIFVTWDDYGGFYDHVPPPQVDKFGYGFRVPCLAISPYAKKGYVDSTQYDLTSILRFIEDRYDLTPLSARDSSAIGMTKSFDFTQAARAFVSI